MRMPARSDRWTCISASGTEHRWTVGKIYEVSFYTAGILISSDAGREQVGWDDIPPEAYAETFGIDIAAKRRIYGG